MFAVIQAIICTLYFSVFLSEAVPENGPAPCFLKKTHERIRVNRAVIEPIITKSLSSEDSKKVLNLAEKESPILIKSLDSEKTQKENRSSLNEESEKANVTDSVLFISNPDNFEREKNSRENESTMSNLTDSAQIIMKSLNLEKTKNKENDSPKANLKDSPEIIESVNIVITKNKEGNSTEKESTIIASSSKLEKKKDNEKILEENKSPIENLTDSIQVIMESLNVEKIKNDDGNSTEKESAIVSNSSNLKNPKRNEKNTTDEESPIVTKTLNSESTRNEEEKSIVKESLFLNKSLDSEIKKQEGNFTENDSLNTNITDSAKIVIKPLKLEQIKEENSTEKELGNKNVTDSSAILTKDSNSENTKIEKGNVTEKESILKNRTVFLQKSVTKGKKSKIRRQADGYNLTEQEKYEVDEVFLRAYEHCKLLRDNHFLRVAGSNPKQIKDCVVKELRKSETYPDEFVKYLDNKEILRKA